MLKVKNKNHLTEMRGAHAYVSQVTGANTPIEEPRTEGLSKHKGRNTRYNPN